MTLRTPLLAIAVLLASATAQAQVQERDHRTQPPPPPPPKPEPKPEPKPVWDSKGWTELGEQVVQGKHDHDTITVGRRSGTYTKLTIVVEDSALELYDVVIHFGNGDAFAPTTRLVFKENSRTRVIDLPGQARTITKVDFHYGNLPGGGKARVELWGFQAPPQTEPPKPTPPPPAPPVFTWNNKGWKLLGERSVDGKKDRDWITVGAYEGRFDQLTFVVGDSDVEITKLMITFENGEKFNPKVKQFFKEGARTRVIDLPGNDRRIKKIEMRYRNVAAGRATVQAWGRDTRPWNRTGWTMLGTQEVKGRSDRDLIRVGAREGAYSKLTLVVTQSDLELYDMTVHFADGTTFSPKLRLAFKEGSRTGVIDLPGEAKLIRKVEFHYGNLPGGGAARVELWGIKVPQQTEPPKPTPPAPTPFTWNNKGWKLLGERSVDGKKDRDWITVGAYEGRFDQLTFVVGDSDVEITKLMITFENGEKLNPKVKQFFKEGARTRVIDLPGNDRRIKKIEMRYRNVAGGRATVQAWGRDTRPWDPTGWTMLGTQEVKGRSDRDTIRVGVREGAYSKLTLVVTESDLELYDMTVHFVDGTTFSPKLRLAFKEGARTGVIDLPGDAKLITNVDFYYGNLPGGGRAKLELWGKQVPGAIETRDHRGRGPVHKPRRP